MVQMTRTDIENWARQIIERAEAQQPVEDARVELKADWPTDYPKAARRLAGHANAAHGEPILWLIGLHEQRGPLGASQTDLAPWWDQVRSCFALNFPPDLTDVNIPHRTGTVVALLFNTDRAPYLVNNPSGGLIQREVPWRKATSVHPA